MPIYVQFTDSAMTKIMTIFTDPQDEEQYPNQGTVEPDDQRYIEFINPSASILAMQSAKLLGLIQLASAQKVALTNRIGVLNDAVELDMATPDETAELPVRQAQLIEWKRYAVLLGRVTGQAGWPPEVDWPVQPADGMDLTVSAVAPDSPQLQ